MNSSRWYDSSTLCKVSCHQSSTSHPQVVWCCVKHSYHRVRLCGRLQISYLQKDNSFWSRLLKINLKRSSASCSSMLYQVRSLLMPCWYRVLNFKLKCDILHCKFILHSKPKFAAIDAGSIVLSRRADKELLSIICFQRAAITLDWGINRFSSRGVQYYLVCTQNIEIRCQGWQLAHCTGYLKVLSFSFTLCLLSW